MHALEDVLKPCPFCGGEAHTVCGDYGNWYVECMREDCICTLGFGTDTYGEQGSFENELDAIRAWNKRI